MKVGLFVPGLVIECVSRGSVGETPGYCYDCRGSPGLTMFGQIRMCPAGNSGAKTDRVRVSNGRPAKGIHYGSTSQVSNIQQYKQQGLAPKEALHKRPKVRCFPG